MELFIDSIFRTTQKFDQLIFFPTDETKKNYTCTVASFLVFLMSKKNYVIIKNIFREFFVRGLKFRTVQF